MSRPSGKLLRRKRPGAKTWEVDLERLRPLVAGLPKAPGVYYFISDPAPLPLYIGKTTDIRSRVRAHLRDPANARLLRQTREFAFERTAGEIGALLLEALRVKQRQPLYNQRLRRDRELCSLRLAGDTPEVVYARDVDFLTDPQLHGLFSSRTAALETLRELADTHRLCFSRLGLERLTAGRSCLRSMLGKCSGVCRGTETLEAHTLRLREALRKMALVCWPHPGALGLVERDGDRVTSMLFATGAISARCPPWRKHARSGGCRPVSTPMATGFFVGRCLERRRRSWNCEASGRVGNVWGR